MVEKARKLLQSGKVERLDTRQVNVVKDHGIYIVVETYDGKISCNCPGFMNKDRRSHSTAVSIVKARSRKWTKEKKEDFTHNVSTYPGFKSQLPQDVDAYAVGVR